jgi:predicted PurR-regulated permease PerM
VLRPISVEFVLPGGNMDTIEPSRTSSPNSQREALPLHAPERANARISLAVGLVLAAAWVAWDFLPALGWAAVLAMSLWPLYKRTVSSSVDRPIIAPLVFTLLTAFVLVIPLILVIHQVYQESNSLVLWLDGVRQAGMPVPDWVQQLPAASSTVDQWWRQNLADPKAAAGWLQGFSTEKMLDWTRSIGGDLLHRAGMFMISLFGLFIMLREGAWIGRQVIDTTDRILGDPGERLAGKIVEAVRGTVNGTVAVAIGEGLLIGAAYFLCGVRNPYLFMVLTAAFAMLPFGAWFAFTAAALLLYLDGGSGWLALSVFGWGAAVMMIGDHFVWPTLVGGAARLPFLFALIGIFGGIQTFGLLGLFLGPTLMAALLTVWREWLISNRSSDKETKSEVAQAVPQS